MRPTTMTCSRLGRRGLTASIIEMKSMPSVSSEVTTQMASEWPIMYSASEGLYQVSMGTTTAPILATANQATTHSYRLCIQMATLSSRETPILSRPAANRLASSFRSKYEYLRSPTTTASLVGNTMASRSRRSDMVRL